MKTTLPPGPRPNYEVPVALRRFTKLTAAWAAFVIFAGAQVTSTGSGLAVPDWPLSYGMFFPPMVGGIFYEHGHRLVAGGVAVLTPCFAPCVHGLAAHGPLPPSLRRPVSAIREFRRRHQLHSPPRGADRLRARDRYRRPPPAVREGSPPPRAGDDPSRGRGGTALPRRVHGLERQAAGDHEL